MSIDSRLATATSKSSSNGWWEVLATALFCLLGLAWIHSFDTGVQLDQDEGVNLMKSLLVKDGYKLYEQIWSDQPPLFTYAYRWWADAFGWTAGSGRMLVFVFSALLLLSLARVTQLLSGSRNAGWIAILLLIGARRYLRLSASVMIGLPAIAVALAGLWLCIVAVRRSNLLLIALSGVLLAASMHIKLFTFFLIPTYLLIAATDWVRVSPDAESSPKSSARQRIIRTLTMAITTAVSFWLLSATLHAGGGEHLVKPHLMANDAARDSLYDNIKWLLAFTGQDLAIVVPAVLGLLWMVRHRRFSLWPLVAWYGVSFVMLMFARPIQTHHRLMLSIPVTAMAGVAIADVLRLRGSPEAAANCGRWRFGVLASCAASLAVLYTVTTTVFSLGKRDTQQLDPKIMHSLQQAPAGAWVFTDSPLYPFTAGLKVPPELAVYTAKRISHGQMSPTTQLNALDRYQPSYIVMARFGFTNDVQAAIDRDFEPLPVSQANRRFWGRKNISQAATPR